MSDYMAPTSHEHATLVLDRLVLKGKGILDLCLDRGMSLCMKGFIDCQIEKGGIYIGVVEAMSEVFALELLRTHDKRRRSLLLDLQSYAAEQLRQVESEVLAVQD